MALWVSIVIGVPLGDQPWVYVRIYNHVMVIYYIRDVGVP